MGILDQLVTTELGSVVRPITNSLVTQVETSATQILRNHPDRVAFTFWNLGAVTIYLYFSNSVSSALGFRISPGGGSITFLWKEDYQMVGWDWHAIADGSASACLTIEQIADTEQSE